MKGGRSWSEINSIVTLITNNAHTWNFDQKIAGGIPENTVMSSFLLKYFECLIFKETLVLFLYVFLSIVYL
jgi:hypothetical protein